jgi:glycosyltransferase involved in cell wall biosynthesis
MMTNLGHDVIHYGGEGSDAPCSEHVQVVTESERESWFHSDWDKGDLSDIVYDPGKHYWVAFNNRAIGEIQKRIEPRDFICLSVGYAQAPVAMAFPNHTSLEYAIGYYGTATRYRCFASEAWRHCVYGRQGQDNGAWYDRVIYHYFDPQDFPLGGHGGDYYLFLGRLIANKGAHIAADVVKRVGGRLVLAGQGVLEKEPGKIVAQELTLIGDHIEHVGPVGVKERAELLGNAKALFVLTQYIAPFEMVHVEAGLCGCPVITTDFGAFTETVENGVTGYRVRTMGEAMWAARNVHKLDPKVIRERSVSRFSLASIAPQYQEWFDRLYERWDKGWYDEGAGRFALAM